MLCPWKEMPGLCNIHKRVENNETQVRHIIILGKEPKEEVNRYNVRGRGLSRIKQEMK